VTGAVHTSIDSDLRNVWPIGLLVRAVAKELGFPSRDAHLLELAVVEAVNNTIQHAYGCQPGRRVDFSLEATPQALIMEIADDGAPILQNILRQVANPAVAPKDATEAECGRGLTIIGRVMDDFSYSGKSGRNSILMRKNLPTESKAE
jgi:serine/threonine-protein kinase RsbW